VRKVAIVSTCSGHGKTTLGRQLATVLEVPFVELDALVHGPNWTETPADELHRLLVPTLAGTGWVIDGNYSSKLGGLVLEQADTVVWLDLPVRVWLPRLIRRTVRRLAHREELWNGNRESLRDVIWGRDALIPFALRMHRERRHTYPDLLAPFPTVRLRTQADVDRFVSSADAT
jgi:adenylate kinase family enzyme